jgi:hypothetical protein
MILDNSFYMDKNIVEKQKTVSYSKYSWWMKCPYKYFLDEIKGLKVFEDSINTCFGTAMHEVVQKYISTLYEKSVQEAESLDLNKMFKEAFDRELKDNEVKIEDDDLYTEFVFDGKNIISAFCNSSTRIANFPNKKYEIIGVEHEIITDLINNVQFKAYIDLILKDKISGRIKIYDFKTSATGWNSFMKDDETKYSQLLLYKAFYSQKYNVPLHMIDVEFFILKRKLFENVNFPQSRIQKFIPEHNNKMIVGAIEGFGSFVKSCFNPDGSYIENIENYPKVPGKNKKHCKWCPHKKVNCDAKATKISSEE